MIDFDEGSLPEVSLTQDCLKRWLLQGSRVRGAVISLDDSWQQIVGRHDAPPAVLKALGELTAAGLLLAATIKFDGFLTLQIQGQGPVSLMVVDCQADGTFRATYRLRSELADHQSLEDTEGSLQSLVNANGLGRFVVTLVPRDKHQQPYQGVVPFDGDQIAHVLQSYMERSEQIPTRLWLDASSERAVGLLLQQMPAEGGNAPQPSANDEDHWDLMIHLASTLQPGEMLEIDQETLMKRLFWEQDLRLLNQRPCLFRCQCSRNKVAGMLQMLGKVEVDGVVSEQGMVKVNCEYCNNEYKFDPVDAGSLFHADGTPVDLSEHVHLEALSQAKLQ